MSGVFQSQQSIRKYFKELQEQLQKKIELESQSASIQNRARSYLVTLLKGKQKIKQIPKVLKGSTSRELRLLAIDRSLTQSMYQFPEKEKSIMNDHANSINNQRDNDAGLGNALRDLVRLARLNNLARESLEELQTF